MISMCLRTYHEHIIHHMRNTDYIWNENDERELLFFHQIHNYLDCSVEEFMFHLSEINFFKGLFLHRNITYYLICLAICTTKDIEQLLHNTDKSLLYQLMVKGSCNLLKRRVLRKLKQVIGEFSRYI